MPSEKMFVSIIIALLALLPDCFGSRSDPTLSIAKGHAFSAPPPTTTRGCNTKCSEPFASAPFLDSCTCVLPMKVKLRLGVSVLSIFPMMSELASEVADGTFLKQSQVAITGAVADNENEDKTVVDLNLLPLGGTFDNTTVILNYQRFLKKKVRLNRHLFGEYDVLQIMYPGFPVSSSSGIISGAGPTITPQRPVSANVDNKNGKMKRGIVLVIAVSAFVLLVVCFGAASILLHILKFDIPFDAGSFVFKKPMGKIFGKESKQSRSPPLGIISTIPASILSVKMFSLAELNKATEKFSPRRLLGEGGFGRVYRGIMENGTEVAVKLLKRDGQNGDREFIAEVEMVSRLHHCNLVNLVGICIEESAHCLVYELVPNGSIESHIHGVDRRKGALSWEARLKIALGAARGLAYLHEDSNPRVIHRDFKASNVLLENDFTPKVSDFGLAREAGEGNEVIIPTRVMGTFGYVAPEYAMTGHLLVKSDVYSYGVVLLELLTGRRPVDMSKPVGEESLVVWARPLLGDREGVVRLADPAMGGEYNVEEMVRVAGVAAMCVDAEVGRRPFMGEVVQALKIVVGDVCCPERELSLDVGWWAEECMTMEMGSSGGGGGGGVVENRSGPLRVVRVNREFREGMSEDSWLRVKRGRRGYDSLFF